MQSRLVRFSQAAGVLAAGVGGGHLAAWLAGAMADRGAITITMKTNAALGLLLCGLSLLALARQPVGTARKWAGRACAALALLIGALTFSEHLVGWNLGIDQLLAQERVLGLGVTSPNRMGPPAALSLTVLGTALLALCISPSGRALHQYPALIAFSIALLPTIGYIYQVDELYGIARYTGIAWPTALALLALSLGVLAARPGEGLLALVTASNPGGVMIRRLLLPVVLVSLALGWSHLAGERLGWFGPQTGTALSTLASILVLSSLVYYSGRKVARSAAATERQKELLAVTLASIGDAVIVTDPHGRITFMNQTAEHLTGWPRLDALDQPLSAVFRIVNEQTRKPVENPVDKVLRSGTVVGLANHTILIARDGREIPIDDSGAPVRAPCGSVHGVVLVFRDFTERKQAEDALRESEAQLRTTVESLAEGVVVSDLDGRLLHWNRAALDMHGFSSMEECRRHLPEFAETFELSTLEGKVLPVEQWPLARILGGEHLNDLEIHVRHLEAGWQRMFSYGGTLVRDVENRPLMAVVTVDDITERKQAEARTQLTLGRFELLAQTASDLLATDSPQTVVERLCRRVVEHLDCQYFFNFLMDNEAGKLRLNACAGIPAEEAQRIEWLDLGVAVCGCVARAGERIVAEDILAGADPRTEMVRSYGVKAYACHPLLAGGQVIGTLSFGTKTRTKFTADELSLMKAVADQVAVAMERIRLFDQARRQAAELTVANKAKDEFIAALSHELRTPLTPVLIISQLLQGDADLPERIRGDMKTIRQNVLLEARLIDDLLDLTRITRGKVQLKQEIVDVHDLLRHAALTCCDEQFAEKHLKLHWDLAGERINVWADPARLEQVFWNLIRNAIKFTPAEGTVTIRTAVMREGRLRVEVIDTGEGIEPDKIDVIFNPFEQGKADRARRFGGLGLGLAIARAIVDVHGGRIEAASAGLGHGSTFSVELALAARPEEPLPPSPDATTGEAPTQEATPRVLLVEDHTPTAIVLQRLMARWGWDVKWAASVHAALETAAQHPFDLVVSDLGLPDGSGHDVMRHLRDNHGLRGIAVSGFGTEEDIRTSLASGFVLHLTKPVDFEELRKAATAFLAGVSQ